MRLIYLSDSQHNEEQQHQQINNVNQHLNNQKPIVIYFYREKCPYCIQTSKEWENINQHIEKENDDLLAVKANGDLYNSFENVGEQPRIFPTIRYVHKSKVTPFTKEGPQRTAYSLAKWIEEMTQQKIEPDESIGNRVSYGLPIDSSVSTYVPEYSNSVVAETEPTIVQSKYTSNKYRPYSNRFIAHNFNEKKTPIEIGQIGIPLKSSHQRSKSKSMRRSLPISRRRSSSHQRSKSKSKSMRRSLPISRRISSHQRNKGKSKSMRRSYNTRFRSVRSKPTQGTTAMF